MRWRWRSLGDPAGEMSGCMNELPPRRAVHRLTFHRPYPVGPHPVDGWHISPIFSIRECQVVGYMNTAYRRGAWPEAERRWALWGHDGHGSGVAWRRRSMLMQASVSLREGRLAAIDRRATSRLEKRAARAAGACGRAGRDANARRAHRGYRHARADVKEIGCFFYYILLLCA